MSSSRLIVLGLAGTLVAVHAANMAAPANQIYKRITGTETSTGNSAEAYAVNLHILLTVLGVIIALFVACNISDDYGALSQILAIAAVAVPIFIMAVQEWTNQGFTGSSEEDMNMNFYLSNSVISCAVAVALLVLLILRK